MHTWYVIACDDADMKCQIQRGTRGSDRFGKAYMNGGCQINMFAVLVDLTPIMLCPLAQWVQTMISANLNTLVGLLISTICTGIKYKERKYRCLQRFKQSYAINCEKMGEN